MKIEIEVKDEYADVLKELADKKGLTLTEYMSTELNEAIEEEEYIPEPIPELHEGNFHLYENGATMHTAHRIMENSINLAMRIFEDSTGLIVMQGYAIHPGKTTRLAPQYTAPSKPV